MENSTVKLSGNAKHPNTYFLKIYLWNNIVLKKFFKIQHSLCD